MNQEPIRYLALGDSIATGSLTFFSSITPYPRYLANQLSQDSDHPVNLWNRGQNGLNSAQLLGMLGFDHRLRNMIKQADLITLSIGGNDLLKAAPIPGFNSIFHPVASQGVNQFLRSYPKIISTIRELNPSAMLACMTLYNPYCCGGGPACDNGLHAKVEQYLEQMNALINNTTDPTTAIADVHSLFLSYCKGKMGQVVALYPVGLLRNPHPTVMGHKLIARCHLDSIKALQPRPSVGSHL